MSPSTFPGQSEEEDEGCRSAAGEVGEQVDPDVTTRALHERLRLKPRYRSLTTFAALPEPCVIRRVSGAPLSRWTRLRRTVVSRSRIVT
jgi:hypothetical protein